MKRQLGVQKASIISSSISLAHGGFFPQRAMKSLRQTFRRTAFFRRAGEKGTKDFYLEVTL